MNLDSFNEIDELFLPFVRIEPRDLNPISISFRAEGEKWASLRFFIEIDGESYRVKEFLLDWFFLGFPKSLMRDFANTYSDITEFEVNGIPVFQGKDYKGLNALSSFVHGTQVEIETTSTDQARLNEVFADLFPDAADLERLSEWQFPDRSFLARVKRRDWFEEERVSRMHWQRSDSGCTDIDGTVLHPSGSGVLSIGSLEHQIMILEENDYSRCVWIETVDRGISISHPFYTLRNGKYLYNTFSRENEIGGRLELSRKEYGPWLIQFISGEEVQTFAFSPGFKLQDVQKIVEHKDRIFNLFSE